MPVDKKYANQIVEMLRAVGRVEGKAMFGGFGIWESGVMFALLDSESTLYFKTDGRTESAYQEEGATQFAPQVGDKQPVPMPYWSVPASVLDDQEELERWAKQSIGVAHAAKPAPKPKATKPVKSAAKKKVVKATTKTKKTTTKRTTKK
jgi:DNA transformation protein